MTGGKNLSTKISANSSQEVIEPFLNFAKYLVPSPIKENVNNLNLVDSSEILLKLKGSHISKKNIKGVHEDPHEPSSQTFLSLGEAITLIRIHEKMPSLLKYSKSNAKPA